MNACMKSMILYSSEVQTRGSTPIFSKGKTLFVRGETVAMDECEALEKASPRKGETILNSIPFEFEDGQKTATQQSTTRRKI